MNGYEIPDKVSKLSVVNMGRCCIIFIDIFAWLFQGEISSTGRTYAMTYLGYEILWLFFIYSFAGWIAETVSAAFQQKRFVNRGLVNAPFCVIYGFTASAVTYSAESCMASGCFSEA